MRKMLRAIAFVFYPIPYPFAVGYHFLVGATLWWWLKFGAPVSYSLWRVFQGGVIGMTFGVIGCIVFGYLLARAEEKEAQ